MATRVRGNSLDSSQLRLRSQQRAVWEFTARVDDWRCSVCMARIAYEDRDVFGQTNLCGACSIAVNESLVWRTATEPAN